jgi:pimeloyl-ACP methyl ester carboxylesterase
MNTLNILSSKTRLVILLVIGLAIGSGIIHGSRAELGGASLDLERARVLYKTIDIDGLDIFNSEAGPKDAPKVLLLHGFPTSSHMFRNLIPALSDKFHVIAPDYPGYGNSSMPALDEFEYTFDRMAQIVEALTDRLGLDSYSIYLMDYGAPIGFRLAAKYPERVDTLIIQNGNAYDEGLREFWEPLKPTGGTKPPRTPTS